MTILFTKRLLTYLLTVCFKFGANWSKYIHISEDEIEILRKPEVSRWAPYLCIQVTGDVQNSVKNGKMFLKSIATRDAFAVGAARD